MNLKQLKTFVHVGELGSHRDVGDTEAVTDDELAIAHLPFQVVEEGRQGLGECLACGGVAAPLARCSGLIARCKHHAPPIPRLSRGGLFCLSPCSITRPRKKDIVSNGQALGGTLEGTLLVGQV